ncbi:hypothetical protein PR048_000125 [Dryococelus australis]|uniref:Uncharacterized protein n=1 Tax=Dryococelus australis TaxID=614101 RepID=A0ABQ9IFZ7_9NEOP|nr:hypothetical protein PR048_000125 [Dryococelus australis]
MKNGHPFRLDIKNRKRRSTKICYFSSPSVGSPRFHREIYYASSCFIISPGWSVTARQWERWPLLVEQNNSTLHLSTFEKEALARVWEVEKFVTYLNTMNLTYIHSSSHVAVRTSKTVWKDWTVDHVKKANEECCVLIRTMPEMFMDFYNWQQEHEDCSKNMEQIEQGNISTHWVDKALIFHTLGKKFLFSGPLPRSRDCNRSISVLVYGFSKYILMLPFKDMKGENITKALVLKIWQIFGDPSKLATLFPG